MPIVQLYDTTLRDGTQQEGISFSVEDKLKIAQKLDELGVDFIGGGWPGSNPKDTEFFVKAQGLNLTMQPWLLLAVPGAQVVRWRKMLTFKPCYKLKLK